MTTLGDKAAYVRAAQRAQQTRRHHCHWPGCPKQVPPAAWGCLEHWRMLPGFLRTSIWATFEPGQEIAQTPSTSYVEIARWVQTWIELYEGING